MEEIKIFVLLQGHGLETRSHNYMFIVAMCIILPSIFLLLLYMFIVLNTIIFFINNFLSNCVKDYNDASDKYCYKQ